LRSTCGIRYRISPLPFFSQSNPDRAALPARSILRLTGKETVLDLFVVTGSILVTGSKGRQVIGIEVVSQALRMHGKMPS
jgi:tRNA/tmRNA/rRNA uracil-C5-methylase (TrmA/RlmC/RlmD family)